MMINTNTTSSSSFLFVMFSLFAVMSSNGNKNSPTVVSAQEVTPTLSIQEQQEAFDFVLNKTIGSAYEAYDQDNQEVDLYNHPSAVTYFQQQDATTATTTQDEFSFRLNRMLYGLFQDAHYRVELKDTVSKSDYKFADMCLSWISSSTTSIDDEDIQLVNTCDTDHIKKGDVILSINGIQSIDYFDKLVETIPHENVHFIVGLESSWLVREDYLKYFLDYDHDDDDDSTISVVIERHDDDINGKEDDGSSISIQMNDNHNNNGIIQIPLLQYNETTMYHSIENGDGEDAEFVSYTILEDESIAIFTLNECIFNEEYLMTLYEFWQQVFENENDNIDTVVLDLRHNRGGDFTVGIAFLQYIAKTRDNPNYQLFDIYQRQSIDFCLQIPSLCDPNILALLENFGVNVNNEMYTIPSPVLGGFFSSLLPPYDGPYFEGELYVVTSEITFSSAHLIAGVIQQNNFGTIIGTPTGNTPNFWGNVIQFDIPNTQLELYVTTSKTVLLNDENDDGGAVIPDVLVPTTVDYIARNRDAQLEWILSQKHGGEEIPSMEPTTDPLATGTPPTLDNASSSSFSIGPNNGITIIDSVPVLIGLLVSMTFLGW